MMQAQATPSRGCSRAGAGILTGPHAHCPVLMPQNNSLSSSDLICVLQVYNYKSKVGYLTLTHK